MSILLVPVTKVAFLVSAKEIQKEGRGFRVGSVIESKRRHRSAVSPGCKREERNPPRRKKRRPQADADVRRQRNDRQQGMKDRKQRRQGKGGQTGSPAGTCPLFPVSGRSSDHVLPQGAHVTPGVKPGEDPGGFFRPGADEPVALPFRVVRDHLHGFLPVQR